MKRLLLSFLFLFFFFALQSQFKKLYDFGASDAAPSDMLVSSGNVLYGCTHIGGVNQAGSIYKINLDGTGYTTIYSLEGGSNGFIPQALILSDNVLYCVCYGGLLNAGILFRINTDGTGFSRLLEFDHLSSSWPNSLILEGNTIFGSTVNGGSFGSLFRIDTNGNVFTNLMNFTRSNGESPFGSLVIAGNILYGVTAQGGFDNGGCIYKINMNGNGGFSHVVDFYGSKGKYPASGLVLSDSTLYGLVGTGDTYHGRMYKVNIDGSGYSILHEFDSAGEHTGRLTIAGKVLYGVSFNGGKEKRGYIYKINTDGSGYLKLYEFPRYNAIDGMYPNGPMIFSPSDSILYGVTEQGGTYNKGVIYSFCVKSIGQTISFDPIAERKCEDGPFVLAATASSGLPIHYTSSNPAVAVISGDTVTVVGAGKAEITAIQEGDFFYRRVAVSYTLNVLSSQACPINEQPEKSFFIPNLFTPNNDTHNDTWSFSLENDPGANVKVFNRAGLWYLIHMEIHQLIGTEET